MIGAGRSKWVLLRGSESGNKKRYKTKTPSEKKTNNNGIKKCFTFIGESGCQVKDPCVESRWKCVMYPGIRFRRGPKEGRLSGFLSLQQRLLKISGSKI